MCLLVNFVGILSSGISQKKENSFWLGRTDGTVIIIRASACDQRVSFALRSQEKSTDNVKGGMSAISRRPQKKHSLRYSNHSHLE
jgi:hypothetical protein